MGRRLEEGAGGGGMIPPVWARRFSRPAVQSLDRTAFR